jgi:transposase
MKIFQEIQIEVINDGMTQREAAEVLGVGVATINRDCSKNEVITSKMEQKPKRKVDGYRITQYTKPTTAAEKIIDKFGVEFSMDLADAILKEMHG